MRVKTCWIVAALIAVTAASDARATTLVLLDNSGSMTDHVPGGGSKAAEAARVLRDTFLPGLSPREETALWTFGGSCQSLQHQGRVAGIDQVRADLSGIGPPSGSTPLGWSIRHALATLLAQGEPRHLIVITDGVDTCGIDPCAEVRNAGAKGAQITVHTVGLGMSRQGREFRTLQCMADASHEGTADVLEPGRPAEELDRVLDRIARDLEEPSGTLLVEVMDSAGRSREGVGYVARAFESGVEHRGLSGTPLSLSPGRYDVDGGASVSGEVMVRPGERTGLQAASDLGRLVLRSGCAGDLSYSVLDDAGRTVRTGTFFGAADLDLAPGRYQVALDRYPGVPPHPVVVERNREAGVQVGQFGTLLVVGRDAGGREVDLPLEVFDDRMGGGAQPVATGETNRAVHLPAGYYNVRVSPDDPRAPQFQGDANVQVRRCEEEVAELRQRAVLRVCGLPGTVVAWNDADGSRVSGRSGEEIPLHPGVYNLELPDGRFVANYRMTDGLNEVECP